MGSNALFSNTSGSYNCADGQLALGSNSTGSALTGIGYDADVTTDGLTNATAIGYLATVDASNKVRGRQHNGNKYWRAGWMEHF
jgi:hypothetical protein